MPTRILTRWLIPGFAACLLLATASDALAQFGGGRMFGGFEQPELTSKELERYAEILDLNQDQKETLDVLFEAYMSDFDALSGEAEKIMEGARDEFRETRDPSVWQDMNKAFVEMRNRNKELIDTFMEDFRLILTEEQDGNWEEMMRVRRRERSLGESVVEISGSGVNLYQILGDAELDDEERSSVNDVMNQYALELDRVLVERQQLYEENFEKAMEHMRERDFEALGEMYEEAREIETKVRDVNLSYLRRAKGILDTESANAVDELFKKQSYPRIYRDSYVDNAFSTAVSLESVTEDQKSQLDAIKQRYERQARSMNESWAEAIDASQQESGLMSRWRRGGDDEIREAARARREFDEEVFDQLTDILTEEQRAELPPKPARENWRERFRDGDQRGRRGDRDGGGDRS